MSNWKDYHVKFIADYSRSRNLSFTEVEQRFYQLSDGLKNFEKIHVPPFSSVPAGFVLEQLSVHNKGPSNQIFYVNVAPRNGSKCPRENNCGEELVFVELENGVPIVATFSGYVLSFVRDRIETLRSLDVKAEGSQFRSRDIFPEAVVEIAETGSDPKADEISLQKVPEKPDSHIGYIDGFGNIKTSIRDSSLEKEKGTELEIVIGGEKRKASYRSGIFEVREGELVLAPGSSGGDDPYLEIVLRGGSAEQEFKTPDMGEKVELIFP